MKRVLVCILIHKKTKELNLLKNINYNKKDKFLIILDKTNIKLNKKKLIQYHFTEILRLNIQLINMKY